MKKIALLVCGLMVVAGAAFAAQSTAAKPATKAAPAKAAMAKTHVVEAEVVSADAAAKTITIKGEPNKTMPVDAAAAAHLATLKAGEKVKLTCRDNDKGEHEAITHIAVEKAAAAKK
jgi:glucose/arabinose dehydrogenase